MRKIIKEKIAIFFLLCTINSHAAEVSIDELRIPLYSITDWHRSPISDSHPFDQPGT